jgi:mono/diheme cytochrome c family protein
MTRCIRYCLVVSFFTLTSASATWATEPSGAELYRRFCASCHGLDATGGGPVAPEMRRPPTDLTTLAQRAGGRFDEAAMMAIIDGRRAVAAHGPREMPVWGAIFDAELKDRPYGEYTTLLRAKVLAEYLASIQTGR